MSGAERRGVTIVILTWNGLQYTRRCLESLRRHTEHPDWSVVVVDNGSTDGTPEWLAEQDWLTVIRNPSNLGFTKGCNQGVAASDAHHDIVLMNNDTVVAEATWLSRLQDVAHGEVAHGEVAIGVVGTRLVDGNGTVLHLGSYMRPITMRGEQLGGLERDINQCARIRDVEAVVFAQVYLRRECLDAVGPLDEDLFAYFEDSDYCLRAQRAGFRVVCAGNVSTVHHQNTSTRINKVDLWSIYNRSQRTFGQKWSDWLEHERFEAEVTWSSVLHQPLGYAVQSRKLLGALHFAGLRMAYRNAYGESDGPTEDHLLDDIARRRPRPDAIQLAFCQADAFGRVRGRSRVGWSMLEVTGLPQSWVDGCNSMSEVWVPASFNVETFRSSGVRVPIRVMPLGVDVDYFHPGIVGYRPSSRFTFLSVFEWGERKAPEVLLHAFAQEFKPHEDVMLLLAVHNRDPRVNVEAEIARLDLPPCAPIVVMPNPELDSYQMGSLYRSADCFVAPSRGEGWGMTVLEAMACGLPAIATGWGGPADFLREDIGYPLRWSLVDAKARCPYYEGFQWAEPDQEHLRFTMRSVVDRPEAASAKGLAAAAEVAASRSWAHVAARVRDRLLELG